MRLRDISNVFSLSCVLFFFHANAKTDCAPGWFGSGCKYKCRCLRDACNENGECTGGNKCMGGWFGPECQYVDLAYNSRNEPELMDGNDDTCLDGPYSYRTKVILRDTFYFTWLRVVVTADGSHTLSNLTLTFANDVLAVDCPVLRMERINNVTADFHCGLTQKIDEMVLEGDSVGDLCSIYVSGGRNVALKEVTFQDTTCVEWINGVTKRFSSDKAVDGNINKDFYKGNTCSQTAKNVPSAFPVPTWIVRLSKEYAVNRYVIYNRGDAAAFHLRGFKLESFDSTNNSVFEYHDTNPRVNQVYKIYHPPLPVRSVAVTVNNTYRTLTLCEVEVYGELVCDGQRYGRDCENICQCPNGDPCFLNTGGCPVGCTPGFGGPGCLTQCTAGKFGHHCDSTCSEQCAATEPANMSACDHVTGTCVMGCNIGFTGLRCDRECPTISFGPNCSSTCSQQCVAIGSGNMRLCDIVTGACAKGCKTGYSGLTCENKCPAGTFGDNCDSNCNSQCAATDNGVTSPCDFLTGACTAGCRAGFSGPTCENVECGVGRYGKDCSLSCSPNCVENNQIDLSSCNETTGACLNGCKSGFTGDTCQRECRFGKYGQDCSLSCNPTCEKTEDANTSPCNRTSGACIGGCKSGFSGETCGDTCNVGKFGPNCGVSCSRHCAPFDDPEISPCNHVSGICVAGCATGFIGDTCENDMLASSTQHVNYPGIVGLCVAIGVLLFVAHIAYKKNTRWQREQRASSSIDTFKETTVQPVEESPVQPVEEAPAQPVEEAPAQLVIESIEPKLEECYYQTFEGESTV